MTAATRVRLARLRDLLLVVIVAVCVMGAILLGIARAYVPDATDIALKGALMAGVNPTLQAEIKTYGTELQGRLTTGILVLSLTAAAAAALHLFLPAPCQGGHDRRIKGERGGP